MDNKLKKEIYQVKLIGLIIDPISKSPVMILKVLDLKKVIPIWIGEVEANAITMELEGISAPRPMTHDLLSNVINTLPGKLDRIIIDCMKENTYHAKMMFKLKDGEKSVDCRPSDAIIVALKNSVDIYMDEGIIHLSSLSDFFSDYLFNREKMDEWFSSIKLDDLESEFEH